PDKRWVRVYGASRVKCCQYLPGLNMDKQGEACRTGNVRQSNAHGRLTFIVNQPFRLDDPARMVCHEVKCCRIPEADDTSTRKAGIPTGGTGQDQRESRPPTRKYLTGLIRADDAHRDDSLALQAGLPASHHGLREVRLHDLHQALERRSKRM